MIQQQPLVDAPNISDKDFSIIKVIITAAATAIAAFFTGYFMAHPGFIGGLISFSTFWMFFTLQCFFIKGWDKAALAIAAEALVLFIPIAWIAGFRFSLPLIFGWVVFLALLFMAYNAARGKIRNAVRLQFWQTSKMVLTDVVTGTLLFMVLAYLFSIGAVLQNGSAGGLANKIIFEPAIRIAAPDFPENGTTGDALRAITMRSVRSQVPAFDSLPRATQENYINQGIAQLRKMIEDKIGPIDLSVVPAETAYRSVTGWVSTLRPTEKFLGFLIFIVTVWLAVRGFASLISWPLTALIFFLYETLIVTNFISIQYESRSREVVVLK